jgi:hypothetical protein
MDENPNVEPGFEFEVVDQDAPFEDDKDYPRQVDSPEMQETQELHAIRQDLDFIMSTLDYLAALLQGQDSVGEGSPPQEKDRKMMIVTRSLWTTALVAYVRCYASGTRYNLSVKDLEEEYPGEYLAEWHEYFKKMRDKHVVHSVSPLEIFGTGVKLVEEEDGTLQVEGLATVQVSHSHPAEAKTIWSFRKLVEYVRALVNKRFMDAYRRAEEKAANLPQEQLRSLQPLQLFPGHDPGVIRPPKNQPRTSQE